jgi:molybdopterin-guanine dinucleotide biosynthesis protein A
MIKELKHVTLVNKEDLRRDDPRLLTFLNVNTETDLKNAKGFL